VERVLKKSAEIPDEELLKSLPASYQDLPESYAYESSIKEWVEAPYQKNESFSEHLTFTSNGGTQVRSKSEVLIANQLEALGIPYRYDALAKLGKKSIYPDFIIKHPFTGKVILWEHFGALHKEDYVKRMYEKMRLYRDYGVDPIYTFEPDVESPKHLRKVIEKHILAR